MKTRLFILAIAITSILNAQNIIIDSSTIIQSQNYSYDSVTQSHTIFATIDTMTNGFDFHNGYLQVDLGNYQGQSSMLFNYGYATSQSDSAKVSLQVVDTNLQVIKSVDILLSAQNTSVTFYFDSTFSVGENIKIAFYSSKGEPYIKQGVLVVGGVYYNSQAARPSSTNDDNYDEPESYTINKNTFKNNNDILSISIYPNPTNGKFYVKSNQAAVPDDRKVQSVKVVDVYGEIVYQTTNQQPQTINLLSQPKGIYFVHITSRSSQEDGGEVVVVEKVVKR